MDNSVDDARIDTYWKLLSDLYTSGYLETYNVILMETFDTHILCDCSIPWNSTYQSMPFGGFHFLETVQLSNSFMDLLFDLHPGTQDLFT